MIETTLRKTFLPLMIVVALMVGLGIEASAAITTLDVSGDTEIDQHVNYNGDNLGSATGIRVEIRSSDYTNPVVSPQSWGLFKWDMSSIPATDLIDNVTFQIMQSDGSTGVTEVYAIDQGAWDELVVSWASWEATTTSETFLGNMTNLTYPINTTFSSSALTARVQDWVDGSLPNFGLLLKWDPTDVGEGDTYTTREGQNALEIPPQLVITHSAVPEPGTAMLLLGGLGTLLATRRRSRSN